MEHLPLVAGDGVDMSSGFDEVDRAVLHRQRLMERSSPGRRFPPSGRRGAASLVKFLFIALCCALFLALVVLRG
jgi:hypothetical protein